MLAQAWVKFLLVSLSKLVGRLRFLEIPWRGFVSNALGYLHMLG